MRPKIECRYQAYTSQEFCFFSRVITDFFSLIVGHRSTMNWNCPSSSAFYDWLKWEIYVFYTKMDKSPQWQFSKKRDSRLSMKIQLLHAKCTKKERIVRFVKYARASWKMNFINLFGSSFIQRETEPKRKDSAVTRNSRCVTAMELDRHVKHSLFLSLCIIFLKY